MTDLDIFMNAPEGATPEELAAYLDEACRGDAELRARVESLFAAAEGAGERFLGETLLETDGELRRLLEIGLGADDTEGSASAYAEGAVIGNYKLLQKIGEGGFGSVYMAEQQRPVKRRVALKIIKQGMDTREVVARFEAERQALAMMDHPGIAKVFDAGATDAGRPYFVMELVKGIPITRFCDKEKLPNRERLELFIEVCGAIQHAHQKGVIHRDIKPSNVLVTVEDARAVVKVIDFGVAKATQMELTDKTLFTRLGQFVGTPAYMSPEQAQLGEFDIDTRSDIYSLGVLLYELLTGRTPFDPERLLSAGYEEMGRMICEEEPPKPSTRVSGLGDGELSDLAECRRVSVSRMRQRLRGDLDWVVMKALEKDRKRRYETANAFAMDVRRHLDDQPVLAAAPGFAYTAGKYARRNRGVLSVAAAVVLLLTGGIFFNSWLFVVAGEAKDDELAETRKLEDQLRATEQARDAMRHQRREAEKAAEEAEGTERQAEQSLVVAKIQQAEGLIASGSPGNAIAELARMVRDNPQNRVATERLISALADRNHPIPLVLPMRHGSPVKSASYSGDGRRIVTFTRVESGREGGESYARVWDANSGESISPVLRHHDEITAATFNADGSMLLTASHDKTVRLRDASGRRLGHVLNHQSGVIDAAFGSDGTRVATVCKDHTAWLWNVETAQLLGNPLEDVRLVRFSPDGLRLVVAFRNHRMQVVDSVTGAAEGSPFEYGGEALGLGWGSEGWQLLTVSEDEVGRVWIGKDGKLEEKCGLDFGGGMERAIWSPDGTRIATASHDGLVTIWDVDTGRPMVNPLHHYNRIRSLAFSFDGKLLVTASQDQTFRVWNCETGRLFCAPRSLGTGISDVGFSADATRVVTSGDDGRVWIWGIVERTPGWGVAASDEGLEPARKKPDFELVSKDGGVQVWDLAGAKAVGSPVRLGSGLGAAKSRPATSGLMKCSWDGTLMAIVHDDGRWVQVWDAFSGTRRGEPLEHEAIVRDFLFDPSGGRLVTLSGSGTVRIWDTGSGLPLSEALPCAGKIEKLWFTANSRWLVALAADSTAYVREIARAPVPAPDWVPAWADALAGQSIGSSGSSRALTPGYYLKEREAAKMRTAEDDYSRAARRSFALDAADPIEVPSLASYVEARLEETIRASISSARQTEALWLEVAELSPMDGEIQLLAANYWASHLPGTPRHRELAVFYARAAIKLGQGEIEARRILASVALADGDTTTALEEIKRGAKAIEDIEQRPGIFHFGLNILERHAETLDATGRREEAIAMLRTAAVGRLIQHVAQKGEDADATFEIPKALLEIEAEANPAIVLVAKGADWKYFDKAGELEKAWRDPDSDDSSWPVGAAELGFGDGDEATLIGKGKMTYYFRHAFDVDDIEALRSAGSLQVRLKRDDGAVIFLNGDEIVRSNLPPGEIDPETEAEDVVANGDEKKYFEYDELDLALLRPGRNHLAVEVHQSSVDSSDVSFDLELATERADSSGGLAAWENESIADALDELVEIFAIKDEAPWRERREFELGIRHASEPPHRFVAQGWNWRRRSQALLGRWDAAAVALEWEIALFPDSYDPKTIRERKDLLRSMEELLVRAGETERAAAIREEIFKVPPRDPSLPERMLDLTEFYNASLYDGRDFCKNKKIKESRHWDLRLLPEEFVPRKGVAFDCRGVIQLNSGIFRGVGTLPGKIQNGSDFNHFQGYINPDKVTIPVARQSPAIHFLVSSQLGRKPIGISLAEFLVHYDGGETATIPVRYGNDIDDWRPAFRIPETRVGWRGKTIDGKDIVLSEIVWENPSPEKTIAKIDFVSAKARAAPFLVAVTLEPNLAELEQQIANLRGCFEPEDVRQVKELLREKERQLEALGRSGEAENVRKEIFKAPPRDPSLPRRLLDLSENYNASLYDGRGWRPALGYRGSFKYMPEQFIPRDGIRFDIRGMIQLNSGIYSQVAARLEGGDINKYFGIEYPLRVRIPVGQAAPAVHFLFSCAWQKEEPNTELARLIVHYEGAPPEDVPLRSEIEISDWFASDNAMPPDAVAWRGSNGIGYSVLLTRLVWENPKPDHVIRHFDFISAEAMAAPILMAITLEEGASDK